MVGRSRRCSSILATTAIESVDCLRQYRHTDTERSGEPMTIYLLILAGYLLGSIPFGVILTRLFGAGDLRQIGSGNIGATNVLRPGRKELAAAPLILDRAKGPGAGLPARQ